MSNSKEKEKEEALYDRTMRELKNKPAIVALLIIGAVLVGLSQSLTSIAKIKEILFPAQPEILEASISIQKFDSVGNYDGSPLLITPTLSDPKNLDYIATDIVYTILEKIHPVPNSNITVSFKISGDTLVSDGPVEAAWIARQSTQSIGEQTGQRIVTSKLAEGDSLSDRFDDPAFFIAECNCIQLEIGAIAPGYQSQFQSIYRLRNSYSFSPDSLLENTEIELEVRQIRLLIAPLDGNGGDSEILNAVKATLFETIKQQITENVSFVIVSYKSQEEYEAAINNIISAIPPGDGKQTILNEQGIDYIVTITLVFK